MSIKTHFFLPYVYITYLNIIFCMQLFSHVDFFLRMSIKSHFFLTYVHSTSEETHFCPIYVHTVELQWLEPLWDHENLLETAVV